MAKNINTARGIELSTKDAIERQRAKKTADDQEKMIQDMDQRNESLGSFSTLIMVLSQNEQDFRDRCTRVVSLANSMGCRIRAIPNLQKEAYQHLCPTYPPNERINEITRRAFPISSFVGGFPFASSGFNDGTGFYLGKDSGGGIILLDLWKREKSRTNSNITIIGGTGTGKSTATKHIAASEYARGTKVIIIDPEGEYKEMCRNEYMEGDWIDVAGGRGGLINPLQVRPAPRDDDDNSDDGMLVADECWTMIDPQVPQSLEFLRNAEKRARKYEGSIVVATQSITDFLDPSIRLYGQAVLDLPSFKLLFGVDGDSLRETQNVFSLNEAQYELLATKQRGIALMKVGSQAVKVKFEFSDKRLALFGKGGGR